MIRITLVGILAVAASLPAAAFGPSEAARAGALSDWRAAAGFAVKLAPPLFAKQIEPPQEPVLAAGTRLIRLSGHVWLRGNAHVPNGSGYAHVHVSGWTTLRDQDGRTLSGSVTVSDYVSVWVNSNYVTAWAHPSAYVSVYEGGKYLGNVRVEGTITVSGWNNNGWVDLSGSGNVDGQLYVNE